MHLSPGVLSKYFALVEAASLAWPLLDDMADVALRSSACRVVPQLELGVGVAGTATKRHCLQLLSEEQRAAHPESTLSYELLDLLLNSETTDRNNRKVERLLKKA